MTTLLSRAKGAMLGLALGDAMGWPSLYHRAYQLPFWTRRLRRELEAEAETTGALRPVVPFSLNQPSEPLRIGPSDDAEWAAFTAMLVIQSGGRLDQATLVQAWQQLAAGQAPVRGPLSVVGALANLRRGILPPVSGHDNAHYCDDGAAVRAIPIGVASAGDPERAAAMAAMDASATNSLDGLWAARAMAAAIAVATSGGAVDQSITAARAQLPSDSWIKRLTDDALAIAEPGASPFATLPVLSDRVVNRVYSYGSLAPETLALTLALVRLTGGNLEPATLLAATVTRAADSLPALVGGLCGALCGVDVIPESWQDRCRHLQGICVPGTAGQDLAEIAARLARLVP